jgi:hypothetical protein
VPKIFLKPRSIKNLSIPTPTQINARNFAKATIIIRQIDKKAGVIKLVCGRYAMSPIHNFISWWQLRMLIIGQPHKMLRDQRNSKLCRELSATLKEILVSGEDHNVSNLVFSLYM